MLGRKLLKYALRLKFRTNKTQEFKTRELVIARPHRNFLFLWVVANAISYSIGGIISAFVTDYVTGLLGGLLSFAVMSMAIALMQWLVIRKQIRGLGWLWATWLGGTLGGTLSSLVTWQLAIAYGDAIDFLVLYTCLRGLTTGLAQWVVLRKYSHLAQWWIVGTTASWYLSLQVGIFLIDKQLGHFLTLVIGAIYGLLTGITLLLLFWLRRRSR